MERVASRITSFDYLKGYGILGVICVHCVPFYFMDGALYQSLFFLLNTLARFAVPFFFVVAGFLYIEKVTGKAQFSYFAKYQWKLLKYYVIWSIFYALVILPFYLESSSLEVFIAEKIDFVDFIYYGKNLVEFFWFLPALMISISIVALAHHLKVLAPLLVVAFILNIAGLFGDAQNYSIFFEMGLFSRDALFFGLFYVALGGCFSLFKASQYRFNSTRLACWFWALMVIQVLERFIVAEASHFKLMGDYYLSTILLTIVAFLWALSRPDMGKRSIFTKVGEQVLGIYIIHSFVQFMFWSTLNNHVEGEVGTMLWFNLISMPSILIISYCIWVGPATAFAWLKSQLFKSHKATT